MISESYLNSLNASAEVREWVGTTLKKAIKRWGITDVSRVEHVVEYLCSDRGPKKLKRMSWPQAAAKADAWVKTLKKKGAHIKEQPCDVKVIHEFASGARIVQLLHERAYKREGFLMSHCVASYADKGVVVYSYRDAKNMPHATFEVSSSGDEILQVKGKGNGSIHPKYIEPIVAFLQSIGHPVRSSEMRLLGYVEINESTVVMLKKNFTFDDTFVKLLGKTYLVSQNA